MKRSGRGSAAGAGQPMQLHSLICLLKSGSLGLLLGSWAAAAGGQAAGERCNSPAGVNGFPLLDWRAVPPTLRQNRERV